ESSLFDLPDNVSFGVGATVAQSYATAVFSLLHRTTVAPDEWVMVLGAGGGVGRAAVDVAKSVGARVVAVASSEEKRRLAIEWGGWAMRNPDANRTLVQDIIDATAEGRYHPPEPAAYPLEDVATVLHDFETRKIAGKVVLVP